MTRGKYAVRAAGARAERSEATAGVLRERLAAERAANAVEVAELKALIERLSGKLTSAVGELADERVEEAERAGAERLAAERARHEAAVLEMFRACGRHLERGTGFSFTVKEMQEFYIELIGASGIEPGEAWKAVESAAAWEGTRRLRRQSRDENRMLAAGEREKHVIVSGR